MNTPGQHLQDLLHHQVPIARAMGVCIKAYDPSGLTLFAPLSQNLNNKGTAFAGSLASAVTLSGWALSMLVVEGMGLKPEVVVTRSRLEYLKPVREDIQAFCCMPDEESIEKLHRALMRKGVARWQLAAHVHSAGVLAVDYEGTYAITLRQP
jgi:thioesterase domain-containing protein